MQELGVGGTVPPPLTNHSSGRAYRKGCGGEEREAKTSGRDHCAEEGVQKTAAEVMMPPFWLKKEAHGLADKL